MAASPKPQGKSEGEVMLGFLGAEQMDFFNQYLKPAQDKLVGKSSEDHTPLLRGRANADAMSVSKTLDLNADVMAGGGASGLMDSYQGAQTNIASTAQREANKRGLQFQDDLKDTAMRVKAGGLAQSNAMLSSAARNEFAEASQAADAYLNRQIQNLEMLGAVAGTAATLYGAPSAPKSAMAAPKSAGQGLAAGAAKAYRPIKTPYGGG